MAPPVVQVRYDELAAIARVFSDEFEQVRSLHDRVLAQLDVLKRGAWVGENADSFITEMNTDVLAGIDRLFRALRQSEEAVNTISRIMMEGEEEAQTIMKMGIIGAGILGAGMGGSGSASLGIGGGGAGLIGIGATGGIGVGAGGGGVGSLELDRDVDLGKFPNSRYINKNDIANLYRSGILTFDEAAFLYDAAEDNRTLQNSVDLSAKIEKKLWGTEGEWRGFSFGDGDTTNGRLSFGSYEAELTARGVLRPDQVDVGLKFEGGAYLARFEGSVEYNGFLASVDAYIGARLEADAGIQIDPKNGQVKVGAGFEGFIGAEATGSIGFRNRYLAAEVQGSVSWGAGAKGDARFSYDNGVLTLDTSLLASLGPGAGLGGRVEINVGNIIEDVGSYIKDQGADGVRAASESVADFVEDLGRDTADVIRDAGNAVGQWFDPFM